jgi:signal transduction histidine kinase
MSLKARLRISIIALVVTLVLALSALNLDEIVNVELSGILERAQMTALDVQNFLLLRVREATASKVPQPANLEEREALWTKIVREDPELSLLLEKAMAAASGIVEIQVTGGDGNILVSSNPSRAGEPAPILPSFTAWQEKSLVRKLREILARRQDYVIRVPLGIRGQERPIFAVRVLISSVLLRDAVGPRLRNLGIVSILSLLASILLAMLFSNLALGPLDWVSDTLDRIARGESWQEPPRSGTDAREFVAVQSKLDVLSEQFRGAKADATELRINVEKLLRNLEEAVLLFDKDRRLAMAGAAAERLLGRKRSEILGKPLEEVFPPSSGLGAAIEGAIRECRPMRDRALSLGMNGSSPLRLLVNVELLKDAAGEEYGGALVTLRDAESRTLLQTQLEVSSRVAAISRLTAGVAHEIKNPLNAMFVHLELLKSRLEAGDVPVNSEVEIIGREIGRLDRVVKTFLDFTRPVELKMDLVDLDVLAREVASLVGLEAGRRGVNLELPAQPQNAVVRGDHGLLRQALLNLVVNSMEAMKNGGRLRIDAAQQGSECVLSVSDQGEGIPLEVQDRIFNLYFTTKQGGSGIGLAIAFRVVQLHNGKIEFASKLGEGTTFRLSFPAVDKAPGDAPSGGGES